MIPKAELLAVAEEAGLLATTVEKDYALGWVLFGMAGHPDFTEWLFKGGTCLKKCYFDTYRFSEDLDFTLPAGAAYDADSIRNALRAVGTWVQDRVGIEFPEDGIELNESINKRGHKTYEGRMTFSGPPQLARAQRQRIRFDLTQDEVIVDPPEMREVFHGYTDMPNPQPKVRCYSNLRPDLHPAHIRQLTERKFEFKGLGQPSAATILEPIDADVLGTDWSNSLRHQLPVLPPVLEFLTGLEEVLGWLLGAERPKPVLKPISGSTTESTLLMRRFSAPGHTRSPQVGYGTSMDRVRYAARNRLLARVAYHGISRLVEPYSLRMPGTGDLLLYVFEVERDAGEGQGVKSFKVDEIGDVQITGQGFQPRYLVEL